MVGCSTVNAANKAATRRMGRRTVAPMNEHVARWSSACEVSRPRETLDRMGVFSSLAASVVAMVGLERGRPRSSALRRADRGRTRGHE